MTKTKRTLAVAAGVLAVFLLLVLNFAVLTLGRQTQRDAEALADTVADCTSPDGTCYTRSQERVAGIVQQLNRSNLYLVQCARVTNTDAEMEACLMQRLQDAGVVPPATPAPSPGPTPSAAQDDDRTP